MDSLAVEDPTLPLDLNGRADHLLWHELRNWRAAHRDGRRSKRMLMKLPTRILSRRDCLPIGSGWSVCLLERKLPSSSIYKIPDISGDGDDQPSAVGDIAKDRLSALRARTMKDFEKQITEFKKENFNLKLRIYFLEEQIQQKFDGAIEDVYKNNIELKVEVESLKHELLEKQNLLIKAFKAVESLAGDRVSKIHHIKEDAQNHIQQMEDFLGSQIYGLEEDLKNCVLEKEEKLAFEQKNGLKRDKTIQGLTLALKRKEKETEELSQQIKELNLTLSEARETVLKFQILKFKGVEDSQIIFMEKETLLADLHVDNTAKDTEICKLLGVMKNRNQELCDLQQEKENLEKELDEAQQQKSRNDKTININPKSRLPVLSKSYRSFIKQGVLADLQHYRAEEELKVYKMQNKEFQEKLDMSELVIEDLKDKLNVSESVTSDQKEKLQVLESVIENLKEKLHMAESAIESLKSIANRMLLMGSEIETQFGNCVKELDGQNSKNVLDDPDELKQRIKDMELQLEKYQNVLFFFQTYSRQVPSSDSFNTFLTNLRTSVEDVLDNKKEHTDDQTLETSLYSSNATEVKRVVFLNQQRMQLKSELQKEKAASMKLLDHVYILQKKIKMSLSRYDSLMQSQAQEISFQRQQMKESFRICMMYHEHLKNLIKAFEELLQANDIDYCVAEGFYEQLNQSLHMLSTLEEKLQNELSGHSDVGLLFELSERYKNDIQKMDKTTDHPQEHYRNESMALSAGPSLSDFETSDKSSIVSLEDNLNTLKTEHGGMMHLPQNLSQDILKEYLQEIQLLSQRLEDSIKTNNRLQEQLEQQVANAELNQDKQNEKLMESLSQANFLTESIRSEYECIKKEKEKLQQQICERDEEIRCLIQDKHKNHNELNRLQSEMNLQEHYLCEEKQVQQSLQIEKNLCKRLTEAGRRKKDNDDGASQCSSSSTVSISYAPALLVPGLHMWADKNGRHILGLIEDYDALCKQISEGQKLVHNIEVSIEDVQNIKSQGSRIKSGVQGSSTSFSASVIRVQQILEKANHLLKLLWRVSLPKSTSCFSQDEDLKSEIARLRKNLSECERKLHSTVKHLHSTRQLKENMEKIVTEQLALTHNVLKKARGNLEFQPVEVQQ
uniref:CDK5 regulatory subunit-associated protein 2-like isoform X2 n=1 Tax=Geotrypetes seraphini TaxID=260995 RepID=A0A6P8SFE6_GEOSA|nr:CDK5 regulatory subunit-associated protein 2-like isoform X2 [Geotrypetes seraphini]